MALCTPDEIIGYGCGGDTIIDFVALSGAALVVSTVMLAAMYVWASFFRNQQLNALVKTELYEIGISAILVVILAGAVGGMHQMRVSTFLPSNLWPDGIDGSTTIYKASGMYFDQVEKDMTSWLTVNYFINMYVDQVASVTTYTRPLGVGIVASPMAGFASPLKSVLYNMSVALGIAFMINSAQKLVYIFALQGFLKYYLPIGIFFRCFTPTRRLGGALIGIAATFIFVFPALTVISYSMFYNPESGPVATFGSVIQSYFFNDTSTGTFWGNFQDFFSNEFKDIGASVSDLIGAGFGGLGQLFMKLIGNIMFVFMMFPITIISLAFAVGFVIPAFNVLIFTTIAKELSRILGDEVDIASLTRLI